MTTLLLFLLAAIVVTWVARKASRTDRTDETDRFAQVQDIVSGWTEEASASQSSNDLANKA